MIIAFNGIRSIEGLRFFDIEANKALIYPRPAALAKLLEHLITDSEIAFSKPGTASINIAEKKNVYPATI